MRDYAQALHDGVGAGLTAALLNAHYAGQARKEAAAWARADARAEDAVHALGQRLLQSQARERALLARVAELEALAQAQRLRACRAEGQLQALRRRGAA